MVVETYVAENRFADLLKHELRWLRTIRAVRPTGYFLSFITFGVPAAALGALLCGGVEPAALMLGVTAAARTLLHLKMRGPRDVVRQLLALPLRDVLSVFLWTWGFATRSVHWKNDHYRVNRDGSVLPVARF